jgi:hypothetical protein
LTAIASSVFAKRMNDQGPGKGNKGSNGPNTHKNEIIRMMNLCMIIRLTHFGLLLMKDIKIVEGKFTLNLIYHIVDTTID